jgi:hypothetical protein
MANKIGGASDIAALGRSWVRLGVLKVGSDLEAMSVVKAYPIH